jgi:hypothetical protein
MTETTANPEPAKARKIDWRAGEPRRGAQPQGGGAVYGLGMIGALVYFAGSAETAKDYALAFGKAVVWPALMVFRAFKALDR